MNKRSLRSAQLTVLLLAAVLSVPLRAADTSSLAKPPVAKKIPKTTEINGQKLVDNYFWLRDKKNPAVKAYLEGENAYTDAVMKPTEPLQKRLYDEMLSRIKETDVDVPYKDGNYFHYSRTEAGKQYPIRCRKKGTLEAAEEVVLDVNELAKGQTFMSLGAYETSDDGDLLAYSTDNTGFRQYTLAVKDLRTGKLLPDHVEKTGSIVWANDNKTLFYTVEDAAKRQYRLYRHTVGTTGPDDLVYEEKDERFNVFAGKTRSKAYIFLLSGSLTTSEARYIPADQPMAEW
jgi:oligopeptidase B